jgi:hypothetical protein
MRAKYFKTMISVMLTLSLVVGLGSVAVPTKEVQAAKYTIKQNNVTMEVGENTLISPDYVQAGARSDSEYTGVKNVKFTILQGSGKITLSKKYNEQAKIVAKKTGIVKIKISATYYGSHNANEFDAKFSDYGNASTTFKVKITKPSLVEKSKLKIKDKNYKLDASDDAKYSKTYKMIEIKEKYNKKKTRVARPVISYKVVKNEGENEQKVFESVFVEKQGKDSLYIEGSLAGTATIKLTVKWKTYKLVESNNSEKWKLENKNYYKTTSTIKVTVVKNDKKEEESGSSVATGSAVTGSSISK